MVEFPISGVETYWWLPVLVAFGISAFTSTAGVSGAFLLLPFQVSVLGFAGPAVSPTNLLFNVVAIPSGVYRYQRERRMVWPLAWTIVLTTLPGIAIKSAKCVMMYSLDRQVLPVDTHLRRLGERLGWVRSGLSERRIHQEMESIVPADQRYSLHVNAIWHGRAVCRALRPRCDACVIAEFCSKVDVAAPRRR